MKLVVEYDTGQYDSHCTHIYCVEYESKEAFIATFVYAFDDWVVHHKKRVELQRNLSDARASRDVKKMIAAQDAWQSYIVSVTHYGSIVVGDCIFAVPEDYNKKYELVALPTVYTIDEWFEANRPVKVNNNALV
jgi:hypothetical protein